MFKKCNAVRTDITVNLNNLEDNENYQPFEMFKTAALSVLQIMNIPLKSQLQNGY